MARYVYILIAHENDNYAAMCLISALSVRGVDPSARITVLCDGLTVAMLKQRRHQLLQVADEVLDCTTDDALCCSVEDLRTCPVPEVPKITSRILKTTLLQRLQTDFIFLDVDTIVVRPIEQRLLQPYSLQAALDRSPYYPDSGFPDFAVPYYQQFGWKCPTRHYYNSGVIFVHADEAASRFFEEWHRRWRIFLASGRHHDQPAFNSALEESAISVGCLPIPYNAMVRVNEAYRWRARVLHFFAEGKHLDQGTEYAALAASVISGSVLTSQEIRKAVSRRWPLVEPWSARRHLKAGSIEGAWRYYRNRPVAGQEAI